MPPAAPQTVRSVETASTLYGSPPPSAALPISATHYRDAEGSSDEEAFDDGWVPVPPNLVHTWRTVAITGAALQRGQSLDLAIAAGAGAGGASLQAKMSAMRVVASCNNLPSLLAPPPVPSRLPPPILVPAPPTTSSGASSLRLSVDMSVSDVGGSLDLAQREPRDSVNAAAAAGDAKSPCLKAAQAEERGRGSPLPWLAPLAKKLRRSTSFGRLVGKS